MVQGKFKILFNRKVGPDYFKIAILAPQIAQEAKPGQFAHLLCQSGEQLLLRRPFSFHRLSRNNFQILYRIIGQGTAALSKRKKGDLIDVLGPLGKGFTWSAPAFLPEQAAVVVAGGMGIAPLLALVEKLAAVHKKKKITVLLGAKSKKELICEKELKKLGINVQIATDDGSRGYQGLVTDLLERITKPSSADLRRLRVYACGPRPMLKAIAKLSRQRGFLAWGSLEERMACGLGACLGCAVDTKTGYKKVCSEGPVFNLKEIKW